jgi:hypothetical protein
MHVNIDKTRENEEVSEVDAFVGAGHLGFSAHFANAAVFDGDATVNDFLFEVGFGVRENYVSYQGGFALGRIE